MTEDFLSKLWACSLFQQEVYPLVFINKPRQHGHSFKSLFLLRQKKASFLLSKIHRIGSIIIKDSICGPGRFSPFHASKATPSMPNIPAPAACVHGTRSRDIAGISRDALYPAMNDPTLDTRTLKCRARWPTPRACARGTRARNIRTTRFRPPLDHLPARVPPDPTGRRAAFTWFSRSFRALFSGVQSTGSKFRAAGLPSTVVLPNAFFRAVGGSRSFSSVAASSRLYFSWQGVSTGRRFSTATWHGMT